MNTRIWTVLILIMPMSSCARKPARPVLPPEKFEAIYVALLEEGEEFKKPIADSARHFDADSLFRSFGTSEEAFRSSVDAYRNNPGEWKGFFEGVIRQLDEKLKKPMKRAPITPFGATPG